MSPRGRSALIAAALGLALLAGCASPQDDTPAPSVAVDAALVTQREQAGIEDCPLTPASAEPVPGGLPDLLLGCLGSGRQVNLAGLRGSPMVINFWAQWCGPCRAEAPSLAQFAQRAHGKVAVLGVDYSDPDPSLALAFAQQSGWTYPHVTDPLRQTAGPIRFTGIPVTIFVDAQGRIVYRTIGAVASVDQLVEATHTYLGVDL
ncbi:TlpA family protein disulfide reductase [Propioniciclava flava]|uniref:TlpA family protein disulfide reductase n=1 Tax=Propioniciclava flava TaxID=2072026 RepID=A0A4Q2ELE0_9ACTN|nr:TlpA disulfide reductase family protein [Propioniciclava flava]RXW32835.1 TlpA family protein disulfide reductase [Propioniciclava flava]